MEHNTVMKKINFDNFNNTDKKYRHKYHWVKEVRHKRVQGMIPFIRSLKTSKMTYGVRK